MTEDFPHVEVAAKQGELFARKKLLRMHLWRWSWMLAQSGLIIWSLYRLYTKGWQLVNVVLLLCWSIVFALEVKTYQEERKKLREDLRWFSLAPAVVQRILLMRDETKRKKMLWKARLEAERRRDRWAP